MDYFLEAIFKGPGPVYNNCFLYLLDKFLANNKNPYPLTYFLFLVRRIWGYFYLLISNVKVTLSSISNGQRSTVIKLSVISFQKP